LEIFVIRMRSSLGSNLHTTVFAVLKYIYGMYLMKWTEMISLQAHVINCIRALHIAKSAQFHACATCSPHKNRWYSILLIVHWSKRNIYISHIINTIIIISSFMFKLNEICYIKHFLFYSWLLSYSGHICSSFHSSLHKKSWKN